jgi:hypothetical protein
MSTSKKLLLLKIILSVKVALCFLYWGLPDLLYTMPQLQRFGVPAPDDPIYLRLLGAVIIAFGVAYAYAIKDPVRNIAILKAGIVDNGLTTLVILYFILFDHLVSLPMMMTALLTFIFFIAFILLMPKADAP